jgi:hypothetical protein
MITDTFLNKERLFPDLVELAEVFEEIRSNKDLPEKLDRKMVLYSSNVRYRHVKEIKNYTGLLFIDIDKPANPAEIKSFFIKHLHTVAVWYSASKGIHALIKIPIVKEVEEFKRRFDLYTKILDQNLKNCIIDRATANPIQCAFINYDPEIYVNPDPVEFTGINPAPEKKERVVNSLGDNVSSGTEMWTIKRMTELFNEIVDNGFPQVRSLGRTLGGWCATSKISEDKALELLEELVNDNNYLTGGDSGGSIDLYVNTALSAFELGLLEPLEWEND